MNVEANLPSRRPELPRAVLQSPAMATRQLWGGMKELDEVTHGGREPLFVIDNSPPRWPRIFPGL